MRGRVITMWPTKRTPGLRCQIDVSPTTNRLSAYRCIAAPTLVMGFADDVLMPPHLGREVAKSIRNSYYLEIPEAGHLGFIEKPQEVNAAALKFFADSL